MHIEIQSIAVLGLNGEVSFRVANASAEMLEFLVRESKHGDLVFRVVGQSLLEVPIEDATVEFLCWGGWCSVYIAPGSR
jgi:hypothetical protein